MKIAPASLLALAFSSILAAAPATAPSVDKLLTDLASDDFAAREVAEDELVNLGAPALEKIKAALAATSDIDLQERLRSAVSRIGRVAGLSPTLVTVDREFQSANEAYEFLCKMFDLPVDHDNVKLREEAVAVKPFRLTVKEKPWILTLEHLAAKTGVNYRLEAGRLVICPAGRLVDDRPSDFRSAVGVLAGSTRRRTTVDLLTEQSSSNVIFNLYVYCEPKARMRTERARMVLTRIEDEKGNSLLVGDPTIALQRPGNGRLGAQIQLKGEGAGKTIAIVEGQVIGEVATRMDEFALDDLSSLPKELKIGDGGEVTVQSLTSGSPWTMVLAMPVQMRRFGGFNDAGGMMGAEAIRVLDQHGRPMTVTIGGQRGDGMSTFMTLSLNSANADARPTKLVWLAVGQTREAKVPFVLKDLPLP